MLMGCLKQVYMVRKLLNTAATVLVFCLAGLCGRIAPDREIGVIKIMMRNQVQAGSGVTHRIDRGM